MTWDASAHLGDDVFFMAIDRSTKKKGYLLLDSISIPDPTYVLNVVGDDGSGTGEYKQGQVLSISAVAPEGTTFIQWTASSGHLSDPFSSNISYSMPAESVNLTAIFETINVAPVADPLILELQEDYEILVTLSASDDNGDTLSFDISSNPDHGTLTGVAPDFSYRPMTNFHGTDRFFYTANDGELESVPVEVNITIHPVNDAPIIQGETMISVVMDEDGFPQEWTAPVLTAIDPDDDALIWVLDRPASLGNVSITGNGQTWS